MNRTQSVSLSERPETTSRFGNYPSQDNHRKREVKNGRTLSLPLLQIAQEFQLDPDITFLNHGSYGACPKPVFDYYQQLQRELESNPVLFMQGLRDRLGEARTRLGAYVGVGADDLVFVPNATHGINIVARSLKLNLGDEVLSSDHEYGAINRTWRFNCGQQGARLVHQEVPLPIADPAEVVERLWAGVNERTRVISLSHITSPTALVFPVEEVCKRAREAGIITVIDGAHATSQVDLDLAAMGVDFYSGNAHKWLSSPKGAAFLYARPELQGMLEPLVVSHGWQNMNPGPSQFLDYFTWVGTDDPCAFLSVPAAIEFQERRDWSVVRQACHEVLAEAESKILELADYAPLSPESMWVQLRSVPLPGRASDYSHLWDEYRIIVPVLEWGEQTMVRISIQAYNTPEDVARLYEALEEVVHRQTA